MRNLIEQARAQIAPLVLDAYRRAAGEGALPQGALGAGTIKTPANPANGDFASTFALQAARALSVSTARIAAEIVGRLELSGSFFSGAAVQAGFINFTLSDGWYGAVLAQIGEQGAFCFSGVGQAPRRILICCDGITSCGRAAFDTMRVQAVGGTLKRVLSHEGFQVCLESAFPGGAEQADCASALKYFRDRLTAGGFDRVVLVAHAERRAYAQRIKSGLAASGIAASRFDAVLTQRVTLSPGAAAACLPETAMDANAFSCLPGEISPGTACFFLTLMPGSAPVSFDPDLAARQDGGNPAYFVGYVCARIDSLIKHLRAGADVPFPANAPNICLIPDAVQKELIRLLARYPDEIAMTARSLEPARITRYLLGLAERFHRFYTANRAAPANPAALHTRLSVYEGVRAVLKSGLELLGTRAPDKTQEFSFYLPGASAEG